MTSINDLGAQSFCFREFKTNKEVIEKLTACGLSKIELCGVHADFNAPAQLGPIVDLYKDGGIDIVSIGVQGMSNEPDKERNYFECAKIAGCK